MEDLLAVCRAIQALSEGLEAELRRLARLETVPARTALLEPGSVAQRLYLWSRVWCGGIT